MSAAGGVAGRNFRLKKEGFDGITQVRFDRRDRPHHAA